jgi:hypothetical protein
MAFTTRELANVGLLSLSASSFSDKSGAATRGASISFFQPGQIKLFLSQDLVNVLHEAPRKFSERWSD